ncbi:MAG: hypothetical protein PVF83_03060 [Anaerolineales bacterium]
MGKDSDLRSEFGEWTILRIVCIRHAPDRKNITGGDKPRPYGKN